MLPVMAWRNIWRNRQRSLITLSAMVFGLFVCLVTFAIGDGAHQQMIRVATSSYIGQIQIDQRGYHKRQKLYLVVPEKSEPIQLLNAAKLHKSKLNWWQKKIKAWSPRVFGAGLVSTGDDSSGGTLLGIDLVRESRVTRFPEFILKAMAKEAILSGAYQDRFPASFLKSIRQVQANFRKEIHPKTEDGKQAADKHAWNQAFYEVIQRLKTNRSEYEAILKRLIRPKEVVLGQGLAAVLKAKVGKPMAIVSQDLFGMAGNDRYTVVGVIKSGSADMDLSMCVLRLSSLQSLLRLEGKYHSLVIKTTTNDGKEIQKIAAGIAKSLRQNGFQATNIPSDKEAPPSQKKLPWEVLPWQRVSPELYEFIRADESGQYMMTLIVFFLVAFIILNTMQMSIMERSHEFGVLMSLGMKGRKLVALVMMEAVWLGLIAVVLGIILGLPVMAYLQAYGIPLGEPLQMGGITLDLRMQGQITAQGLFFSPMIVLFTAVFVSFFPAYRVSRWKPIEALRRI